jgi:excisionase family DNA binding protein
MSTERDRPAGISREKAAAKLGDPPIHLRTIDRLIKRGKLKAYRVGSRVFVLTDSIDEYLEREAVA